MMKIVLTLVLTLAMAFTLSACGGKLNDGTKTNLGDTVSNHSNEKQADATDESKNENSDAADVRIKLTFDNEEVIVKMDDHPTSRDFLGLLPLTLTLEDYAGTEKIHYLEKRLSTVDAPSGVDPSVGDFTYYSPWGNLAIFYKDFHYSNGLIKLGKIESGIDKLASITGVFTVKIEKMD